MEIAKITIAGVPYNVRPDGLSHGPHNVWGSGSLSFHIPCVLVKRCLCGAYPTRRFTPERVRHGKAKYLKGGAERIYYACHCGRSAAPGFVYSRGVRYLVGAGSYNSIEMWNNRIELERAEREVKS